MSLFGTNGVRGIVGEDMTVELAQRLGRAIAAHYGPGTQACLGHDARVSSDALAAAAASGLMAGGMDVVEVGLAPTPAVQHAVKTGPHDCGVIVTASHNPPEFNGIKVVHGDGTELPKDREATIEDRYFAEDWETVAWDGVGTAAKDPRAVDRYVDAVASHLDADAVAGADLDVVLDCGNGAGCVTAPRLLADLEVRCVSLNAHPDGTFPGHPSEPSPENAADLMDRVAARGADLGVIQDGDADRCIFVDDEGRYVPGERMLALLAADYVRRHDGGLVVTPVATSLAVEEMVEAAGGEVRYTAVGSPIVTRVMMDTDAIFGGEGNGGYVFPDHQHCRDALMTMARGIELLARRDRPLSELLSEVPAYATVKEKVACPEDRKAEVLEALTRKVADEQDRVDTTDGLKIWYDDGWVLVRPSGTEPIFRVFAESRDEATARDRAREWMDRVAAIVGGDA